MAPFLNIAAYKFVALTDLKARRQHLLRLCGTLDVRGSILLSPEGINLFVAGEPHRVDELLRELRSWPGLQDLEPKISGSESLPFRRMHVRVKKEIIAFGVEGIDPARHTSPKIAPEELRRWLDEGRRVTLLDTRNDYEVQVGTFANAVPIGIAHFREFPDAAQKLDPALKEGPVVIFCTGGIRCEKAGPYLESQGFTNVLQLDGGILKYFEACGGAHYRGECFVFDQRTGLDPALQPKEWTQCFNCRTPLCEADQAHSHYEPGKSCPYCFKTPAERMRMTLERRREQVNEIIVPLPGSIARDHFRPTSIPAVCDGMHLIDALCRIVPHISFDAWHERFNLQCIVDEERNSVDPERIVRGGERYLHRFPGVIEPDVNMQIDVLYEDESIVVLNKPAPLPMHAGGRFHHNTLKYVLDALYRPQQLRPAHRLDANTTGVLVAARTQFVASRLQPQFARGEVEKRYLVRVQGHPVDDAFACDAPISSSAGQVGSRIVDEAGLVARTEFRVLCRSADGTALVEAKPLTGRTNQIRVHLWHLGFPVCGDQSYLAGNRLGTTQTLDIGAAPMCLHAWQITFTHPLQKERVAFIAPAPTWVRGELPVGGF